MIYNYLIEFPVGTSTLLILPHRTKPSLKRFCSYKWLWALLVYLLELAPGVIWLKTLPVFRDEIVGLKPTLVPVAALLGNTCQKRKVSSPAPVTILCPSGDKARKITLLVCPCSVATLERDG